MINVLGRLQAPPADHASSETHEMSRRDLTILMLVNLGFGLAIIVRAFLPHGG